MKKKYTAELVKIEGLNGNDTQWDVTISENGRIYQLLHLSSVLHYETWCRKQTGRYINRHTGI